MKIYFIIVTAFIMSNLAIAKDGHDHGKKEHKAHQGHKDGDENDHDGHDNLDDHKEHKDHKDGDEHGDHGHDDHDDHGHDDHGGGKAIGEGKAIIEVSETKGFKLSKEAIKNLKLKLLTADGDTLEITKETLVSSKDIKGIYRFRSGFFKLLKATILKETKTGYKIKVNGLEFGDQVVVNGVGLLRVSDIYSTDKSEYGHSH